MKNLPTQCILNCNIITTSQETQNRKTDCRRFLFDGEISTCAYIVWLWHAWCRRRYDIPLTCIREWYDSSWRWKLRISCTVKSINWKYKISRVYAASAWRSVPWLCRLTFVAVLDDQEVKRHLPRKAFPLTAFLKMDHEWRCDLVRQDKRHISAAHAARPSHQIDFLAEALAPLVHLSNAPRIHLHESYYKYKVLVPSQEPEIPLCADWQDTLLSSARYHGSNAQLSSKFIVVRIWFMVLQRERIKYLELTLHGLIFVTFMVTKHVEWLAYGCICRISWRSTGQCQIQIWCSNLCRRAAYTWPKRPYITCCRSTKRQLQYSFPTLPDRVAIWFAFLCVGIYGQHDICH